MDQTLINYLNYTLFPRNYKSEPYLVLSKAASKSVAFDYCPEL